MSSLEYKRHRAEAKLRESCSVEQPATPTSNGKGGRNPGTPLTHLYPCTFKANSGNIERGGDRELLKGSYRVRLAVSALVKEGWPLLYGGRKYTIVWAPPVGEQDVTRTIGVNDAP